MKKSLKKSFEFKISAYSILSPPSFPPNYCPFQLKHFLPFSPFSQAENREQVSSSNERFQAKEEIDERERYEEKIRSGTSPSAWSMSGDHGRDSEKIEGTMGKASQGIAFCNEKK